MTSLTTLPLEESKRSHTTVCGDVVRFFILLLLLAGILGMKNKWEVRSCAMNAGLPTFQPALLWGTKFTYEESMNGNFVARPWMPPRARNPRNFYLRRSVDRRTSAFPPKLPKASFRWWNIETWPDTWMEVFQSISDHVSCVRPNTTPTSSRTHLYLYLQQTSPHPHCHHCFCKS